MFPDVEGQERFEALGDRVAGVGFLGDDEGAALVGGEPDPAGAEETDALRFELGFKGVEGAPLFVDLGEEFRFLDFARNDRGRAELREIQIMIQYLPRIIEHSPFCLADNLLQGHVLEGRACNQLVQVIDITLQVLAVVEGQGIRRDDGLEGVNRIG